MSEKDKFSHQCITSINNYRQLHQVPPLTLNPQIQKISQAWADQLAAKNSFGHNPSASYMGETLGENCAMNYRSDGAEFTGDQASAQWYQEIDKYDFKSHSGPNTGHFTQLVWKSSRECGFGRSQTRDGKWLVIANFFPAGNYIGQHATNVFPPSGSGISCGNTYSASSGNATNVFPPSGSGISSGNTYSASSGNFTGGTNATGTGNFGNFSNFGNFGNMERVPFSAGITSSSCTNNSSPVITREVHEEKVGSATKVVTVETKTYPDGRVEKSRSEQTKGGNSMVDFNDFNKKEPNAFSSFNFPSRLPSNQPSGGGSVRRQVHEETTGSGPNAVTKVITIETTTYPDGRVETKRSEQSKSGSGMENSFQKRGFDF